MICDVAQLTRDRAVKRNARPASNLKRVGRPPFGDGVGLFVPYLNLSRVNFAPSSLDLAIPRRSSMCRCSGRTEEHSSDIFSGRKRLFRRGNNSLTERGAVGTLQPMVVHVPGTLYP